MFRITNLMPVYEQDGTVLEYRISVDNGVTEDNSVSANLVIDATDIDITAIAEVCKQKLQETVNQRVGIMTKDEETGIWFEVLQRLTKIETNTEGLNEISGVARNALAKSEENSRDIEEIKEKQKWTVHTIAGIGVTFIVYFITKVIERQ